MALLENHTDEELIDLLRQDDQQAFETLYNRYWKRMLIKAYALLGSEIDAEEVVQNTFINIWQRRDRLQLKFSFHTYLASAVKYEVMALLAKKDRYKLVDIQEAYGINTQDNSTQEYLEFVDLSLHIETTIQALPEKCRLVYRMSREESLSEKQIAEILVISPKTVQAHMTKALKTLRISLGSIYISLLL
ncbi:RNA polymerase sigma-70 factor [Dyadobacter psychrotolerans]|uniref:RNA polymerase sigma-70 factor n=1 Tax=Dyadobacter psychrotolerans TaxID=2541721 RepID=A0A4R5DGP5_9BACT|nr:RNA polymerase sigma-70 factor [Dyadobacter psychrotolerans]TDE09603.1 RNA polymerase sigma-70 factor [Dyadobacter psychrotolerans]